MFLGDKCYEFETKKVKIFVAVLIENTPKVRNSIKRLEGNMPYDLSTPDSSLKELEKESNIIK